MSSPITEFRGSHFFLSNLWFTPIVVKGVTYKSVEHAYQALKTDNEEWRQRIINAEDGVKARRIGRSIPSSLIRPEWDDVRLRVMEILVKKKFSHPALQALLLKTGDAEIIHVNTWNDTFYGVCNGKGENHLGKLLMLCRHMLQEGLEATPETPAPAVEPPKEPAKTKAKASRKPRSMSPKPDKEEHTTSPSIGLMAAAQALSAR